MLLDAKNHVNTGNFLLRNHCSTFEMLNRIWEQTQFTNHPWWENKAFIDLLEKDSQIRQQTMVVANRQMPFNSYPHHSDYVEGDFIIHFAGVHDLGRLEQLTTQYYRSLPTQLERAS